MIRLCNGSDFQTIWAIINEAARAYKGIIPADCWAEPYMSAEKLRHEIDDGVIFWGWEEEGELTGVMGLQEISQVSKSRAGAPEFEVRDVTLIRHAYVLSRRQRSGVGGRLLKHLLAAARAPVLIGTWADAHWAIRFYEKNGFEVVTPEEKDRLLRRYWSVPERQIETSVVLADAAWREIRD
ncbi:MAG: GNAT family N-acetyltransferase [Terracidiphilus sp.]